MFNDRQLFKKVGELASRYPEQFGLGVDVSLCIGWLPILDALFEQVRATLSPEEMERFCWEQIKQKYGELRAYFVVDMEAAQRRVLDKKIEALIEAAAERASKTCEICGAPGEKVDESGWLIVACPAHRRSRRR